MEQYRIMWKNRRTGLIGGGIKSSDKEMLERVINQCEENDALDTSGERLFDYWIEPAELITLAIGQ